MTDETFKQEFFKEPTAGIKSSGYAIDSREENALAKLKPEDIKFEIEPAIISEGVEMIKKVKQRFVMTSCSFSRNQSESKYINWTSWSRYITYCNSYFKNGDYWSHNFHGYRVSYWRMK